MTKDDIHLLYGYDRWANARVLQACSLLSAEQFTRDLGGSFSSVRDTFVHIIAGEWGWLQYWKAPSPDAASVAEMMARRKVLFDPASFAGVAVECVAVVHIMAHVGDRNHEAEARQRGPCHPIRACLCNFAGSSMRSSSNPNFGQTKSRPRLNPAMWISTWELTLGRLLWSLPLFLQGPTLKHFHHIVKRKNKKNKKMKHSLGKSAIRLPKARDHW